MGRNTLEDLDTVVAGLEESEKDNLDDIDKVMAVLGEVIVRNKNILESTEQAIDNIDKLYSCDFC